MVVDPRPLGAAAELDMAAHFLQPSFAAGPEVAGHPRLHLRVLGLAVVAMAGWAGGAMPVVDVNVAAVGTDHAPTVRPNVITDVTGNVTATSSQNFFLAASQSPRLETATWVLGRTPPLSSHGDVRGDIVMRS